MAFNFARRAITIAALAVLGCSSNSSTDSGGSQQTGGASGGKGGTTASGGGGSAGGAGAGGASTGDGGAQTGGAGAGSAGEGGTVSGGAGTGGARSGGAGAGGTTPGGAGAGGAGAGGTGDNGGAGGSGGNGSGGSGSGGNAGNAGGTGGSSTGGTVGTGGAGTGGSATAIQSCPALPGAPEAVKPLPSPAQVAYQRTEMTAFIHYSMATYDGSEQGNAADPVSLFKPTNLDASTVDEWASSLKNAGFGQAMLVTKHSVGFCLWPSKYTNYSIKSTTWGANGGDIVQLFSNAMKTNGMRSALYLGPWDQKYTSSKPDYETYFKNQVTEILAYGPAYEIEFDGYNAPTTNVNWKSMFQYIKQLQPNILIWAGPEIVKTGATPDVQWIGNENGEGTRTTSSLDTKNCGGGSTWCPYECNVSSHRPDWFWHPNKNPISLADMQAIYFRTVGMNCTLNFNVPPSQTGQFDPKDLNLLKQFGTWYASLYKTNLAKDQPAKADSTWATAGFEASKAVDNDICTYWAAASGKKSGRIEISPASPITFKLISIREPIELGERATAYHVEIKQNGTWNTAPADATGTKIKGTVIGQRQLWQLSSTTAEGIALVIDNAKDVPAIAEFSVY